MEPPYFGCNLKDYLRNIGEAVKSLTDKDLSDITVSYNEVKTEYEKTGGKEYTNMLRAVYVRNPLKKVDTLTLKQFEKMKDAYEKKS